MTLLVVDSYFLPVAIAISWNLLQIWKLQQRLFAWTRLDA